MKRFVDLIPHEIEVTTLEVLSSQVICDIYAQKSKRCCSENCTQNLRLYQNPVFGHFQWSPSLICLPALLCAELSIWFGYLNNYKQCRYYDWLLHDCIETNSIRTTVLLPIYLLVFSTCGIMPCFQRLYRNGSHSYTVGVSIKSLLVSFWNSRQHLFVQYHFRTFKKPCVCRLGPDLARIRCPVQFYLYILSTTAASLLAEISFPMHHIVIAIAMVIILFSCNATLMLNKQYNSSQYR